MGDWELEGDSLAKTSRVGRYQQAQAGHGQRGQVQRLRGEQDLTQEVGEMLSR